MTCTDEGRVISLLYLPTPSLLAIEAEISLFVFSSVKLCCVLEWGGNFSWLALGVNQLPAHKTKSRVINSFRIKLVEGFISLFSQSNLNKSMTV